MELVLRGDGDSSLMDLLTRVAQLRRAKTIIEHGPRDDGQAHGRAERSVRTIEELVRVQLTDFEARTGESVDHLSNLFGWIVRHATDLSNKRMAARDGTTPWEKMRGRPYRGQLLRFGVPVMHRLAGETVGGVLLNRWSTGVWVGKTTTSDEHMIALPTGQVIRARAVRELDDPVTMDGLRRIIPCIPVRS